MTATACALAALLTFEAATAPAAKDECELADHRCKAVLFERRAANAANAEHRAVYLFNAHRLYMRLFDQSGAMRDLCAARRTIDASLAVEGQSPSLRAKSEALRADLLAREKQQDTRCGSVSKQRRVKPADAPLVARGSQPPAEPTPDDPAPPLLAGPEPSAVSGATATAGGRPNALQLLADADIPTTQPAEVSLLPVAARQVDVPRALPPRSGRGLVIAGGATLGVGAALAVGAGLAGRRMSDTRQEIIALSERVDGYATADQVARDAGLRSDYESQRHQRLALTLASGATIVVAMILAGVGGRRMARAASQSAFIPAPGGLVFRFRF
jgi:hypothetical protein